MSNARTYLITFSVEYSGKRIEKTATFVSEFSEVHTLAQWKRTLPESTRQTLHVVSCIAKNDKPTNEPNGKPQYYVSTCPDTGKQFLVEHGRDNNLVELTMENAETIRRQFLHKETPTGKFRRQADLMKFLSDEHKRYQVEIQPLYPSDDENFENTYDFEAYDEAKTEFLESLWDVISQHFDDANKG